MHCPYCKVEYTHETPCFCQSKANEEGREQQREEQETRRAGGAQMTRSREWYAG